MGFMNRRKTKEQEDGQASDSQIGQPSTSKKSKKGKKNVAEPKLELDLSTALPGDDSFRTSLMLPNLSTRFSMLREQDDPSTKIGKANDDSVLFPKRASRLNLFDHNPLTDIAEVSSVRSSIIRPPFVRDDHARSVGSDGYASDEGSIMNRSKPGEGNNLFGGRQKLYRIPVDASSAKTLPDTDASEREASRMNGRVVYQNDVSLSTFQQIREKQREERRQREQHHRSDSSNNTEMDEIEGASSPSTTAFSKDRGTASSTTSGPLGRRTSTAATSVASEPRGSFAENRSAISLVTSEPIAEEAEPFRHTTTAPRKLYGQAVDQSSPTHRAVRNVLEGSTRPRAATYDKKAHTLSLSKSASNLAGNYSRPGPFSPPVSFRTASPPPSSTPPGMVPMDLGIRDNSPPGAAPGPVYGSLPPLSPPASDGEDVLTYVNSLQPEDRGKATAMGLFNRPQRQYDELQFSKRQVQMHQGRISPLPTRQSPERRDDNASPFPLGPVEKGRYSPANNSENTPTEGRYSPPSTKGSKSGYRESPQTPSNGAWSQPAVSTTSRTPNHQPRISPEVVARARARADSSRSRQHAEPASMEADRKQNRTMGSSPHKIVVPVSDPADNGTFLDNFSPSDDEEPDAPFEPVQPSWRRPLSGVHPALRDGAIDFGFEPSVPSTSRSSNSGTLASDETERTLRSGGMDHAVSEPSPPSAEDNDGSPTALTPGGSYGLSGMIRSHLRHDSDKSSIYLPTSVSLSRASVHDSARLGPSARLQNQPESIHSNPWEFDDVHARSTQVEVPNETQDPLFVMSQRAKQIRGQATAFQTQAITKAQQVLGDDVPLSAGEAPVGRSWQEEMRLRHQRDESIETKHETQKLDNELAERRRMVEETFQNRIGSHYRPASPTRHPERNVNGPTNPLSALKHKTSKSSLQPRQPEHHNKAMKVLGIANGGTTDGSPDMAQEDQWKEEEERMLREHARRKARSPGTPMNGPRPPYTAAPRAASPRTSPSEDSDGLRQSSVTPTTARPPRRDRAETLTGGPPRTRGRPPREETERPMIAGTGNYGALYDKSAKPPSVISLPRPSLDGPDHELYERSALAMSRGRVRSNSRPTAPGYFDNAASIQSYNEPASAAELPPPLPIQAYSANSTPPLNSPALSNGSTPTLPSHPVLQDMGQPSSFGYRSTSVLTGRKKSVTKNMISDPTLLSTTSNIPAVSLPAPPNFRPHELASPPLPTMNSRRRRQTTTQMYVGTGNNDMVDPRLAPMSAPPNHLPPRFEERSTFSDEGEQRQPKQRARLRKTSSEGGSMNLKARQQAMMATSPAMPRFPPGVGYSKPPPPHALNGGMF